MTYFFKVFSLETVKTNDQTSWKSFEEKLLKQDLELNP